MAIQTKVVVAIDNQAVRGDIRLVRPINWTPLPAPTHRLDQAIMRPYEGREILLAIDPTRRFYLRSLENGHVECSTAMLVWLVRSSTNKECLLDYTPIWPEWSCKSCGLQPLFAPNYMWPGVGPICDACEEAMAPCRAKPAKKDWQLTHKQWQAAAMRYDKAARKRFKQLGIPFPTIKSTIKWADGRIEVS